MEYVILTVFVAILFFGIWQGTGFPWFDTEDPTGIGLDIQGFFQRITTGIALPIP